MDSPEERAFLHQLHTATQGDPQAQASMYDIGETLGLDRAQAGTLAESLFIQGLAELKTLSGGMAMTPAGFQALDLAAPGPDGAPLPVLGTDLLLCDEDHKACRDFIERIQADLAQGSRDYPTLEAAIMDLKTLEVHLLSPRAKTAVVREIFRSLAQYLETGELCENITHFISS